MRLVGTDNGEPLWNRDLEFVGESDPQLQDFLLDRREIAHAHDLELLLVALGNALDHVGSESPGQAVYRTGDPPVVGPRDQDLAARVVDLHRHRRVDLLLEFAERAFDQQRAAAH